MKRRYVFLLVVMTMAAFGLADRSTPAQAHPGGDGCPDDPPWDRPDGLLIMQEATSGQYLVEACGKRPFLNADDLASHYFDSTAATVSPQEMSSIVTGSTIRAREGTLYRKTGDTAVWTINVLEGSPPAYYKRFISGALWTQHFANCGYTDAMIRNVPASVVDAYPTDGAVDGLRPDGQLVISGSAQYLIEAGKKRLFPYASALASYNFPFPACSGNLPTQTGAEIKAREGTWFKASGGTVKYLVDQVGTAYHKRSLSTNSAASYALSGTPRTWPSSDVNAYAEIAAAHMIKTQWLPTRSWYKVLTIFDLGAGTEYIWPVTPGSWDTAIGLAEGSWNSAPIWPDFVNTSQPTDVNIHVMRLLGDTRGGWADPLFEADTIVSMDVTLNARYSPHTELVAHELGHTLLLDHDGLNPDGPDPDDLPDRDYRCGVSGGWRVPETIMDYDCYLGAGTSGPVDWDWCGVNHRHQSGGQWSGC